MMHAETDTDWTGDEGDTENEFTNGIRRKSQRKTLGKKPERYGEWHEKMTRQVKENSELTRESLQALDRENPLYTIKSTANSRPSSNPGSIRSMRTTSSMTRRRIQEIELAAAKKAADLEEKLEMERRKDLEEARKRKLERENKLIQMQLDMEKDQIEDEFNDDRSLRSRSTFSNKNEQMRRYNKLIGNNANENAEMRENISMKPPSSFSVYSSRNIQKEIENSQKGENITTNTIESFLNSMSKLLDSKMNNNTPTPSQDMNKFLARQTTSKFLPDFDGNSEEWPTFICRFRSSTESCGFSKVENLDRLQNCLKGKAKDAVQAMMYSSENVEKIIETLEMSFGRPHLIIKILMKKTKDMNSLTEERPTTLIQFSNAIQNLISTMEALKCTSQMRNSQLLEDLVTKLPARMKMDWGKHIRSLMEEETLMDFAEWMKNIALSASRIQHLESHEESYKPEEKVWKSFPKPEKIFTLPVNRKEKENESKKCLFCDRNGHDITECKSFLHESPDNRWEFATVKRICFSCLKNGHQTTQCYIKDLCGIENCKFHHHILLHNKNASKENTEPTIHITETKKIEKKALLMICRVVLSGPNGKIKTHALLDSGATGTYLDATIAKKLGLNGEKKKLNMKWFNDMTAKEYDSLQVDLKISTFDEKETFNLSKVKTIKNMDLPRQTVNVEELTKTWKHLKKYPELSFSNAKPTILIGQDHTHLIMGRENIENNDNGPVITKTKLGWILHGNVSKSQPKEETENFLHINDCTDETTREDKPCNFNNNGRWLKRPDFLKLPEHECSEIEKYAKTDLFDKINPNLYRRKLNSSHKDPMNRLCLLPLYTESYIHKVRNGTCCPRKRKSATSPSSGYVSLRGHFHKFKLLSDSSEETEIRTYRGGKYSKERSRDFDTDSDSDAWEHDKTGRRTKEKKGYKRKRLSKQVWYHDKYGNRTNLRPGYKESDYYSKKTKRKGAEYKSERKRHIDKDSDSEKVIIVKVYPRTDNQVRVVDVKTQDFCWNHEKTYGKNLSSRCGFYCEVIYDHSPGEVLLRQFSSCYVQ